MISRPDIPASAISERFQVHKLKIDRSFIKDANVDQDHTAITSIVISTAKSLNLKIIVNELKT